ncbi:neutral zinc metallopeptidase [Kribbella sp. NPDC026596]|uniref:neutral zinc metallopeptidase n=1 Tax=Kribbella sp. NPDC026596 TaxID=3155122 RepID=UPI0033C08AB3
MSDRNPPPPGSEPADGEQPAGPPQHGPGESRQGQPAQWWVGEAEAKREFQDPATGERPPNNWFGEGWANRRPENPDQPSTWQTNPEQSRPTPPPHARPPYQQSGPQQQSGAHQPRSPQTGPAQRGPVQPGPGQPGPAQPRPEQHGPSQQGPSQQGRPPHSGAWQSQSSAWQSDPSQSGPPPQQGGPRSEDSYLWGSPNQPGPQQPASPWSNALPPQQQRGPRHASGGGQLGPMGQRVQQAPNWQYPPIPIPQPPGGGGRRRKPKKTSRGLLIGLVVLAVLVVGSGITLLVRTTGNDDPQAKDTPSAPASETTSATPSESPSPTATKPPAPTADDVVKANKLYTVGPVSASKCAEPAFAPVTVTAARAYYARLLPCLNRTWLLAMQKAGLPFRAPKAVVYSGKLASPCGIQRSARAAYCAANETIYLPYAVDNAYYKSNPMYTRAIMLNTFAHEYGHHVQYLSGILVSSVTRAKSMTPNQKLQESRRRELQATCLGAVYLGANAVFTPMRDPLLANWKFLISHTGDDYARPRVHDHGNRVSNYQWSIAGFNSKQPNSCNTFTATDIRVS